MIRSSRSSGLRIVLRIFHREWKQHRYAGAHGAARNQRAVQQLQKCGLPRPLQPVEAEPPVGVQHERDVLEHVVAGAVMSEGKMGNSLGHIFNSNRKGRGNAPAAFPPCVQSRARAPETLKRRAPHKAALPFLYGKEPEQTHFPALWRLQAQRRARKRRAQVVRTKKQVKCASFHLPSIRFFFIAPNKADLDNRRTGRTLKKIARSYFYKLTVQSL